MNITLLRTAVTAYDGRGEPLTMIAIKEPGDLLQRPEDVWDARSITRPVKVSLGAWRQSCSILVIAGQTIEQFIEFVVSYIL
ncbi:hypothetical protein, partial [Paraburkholderia sp. RL17-373-BIF-A]|uniref:hypothetical protein n=1 Tax=Paraburkholderia sp. RL17-373-BIF-A TaxID=3031629 RepID=UPI0038BC9694